MIKQRLQPILCTSILLTFLSVSVAAQFQGVEYTIPSGWKSQPSGGGLGFVPNDVKPELATVLALGAAEDLAGKSFDDWFQQKLKEELQDGSTVLKESDIQKVQQGALSRATVARVVQDPQGTATLRTYHGVSDGRKAAFALSMSVSEEGAQKYLAATREFFNSLQFPGSALTSAASSGKFERVPASGIVNGVPQGIFIGRSLLTGRAVCLLFLSGGRITRAIPEKGLENFDWAQHQSEHSRDSGTWQMRGNQLHVEWGDGGVHEGPLTATSDGVEFYGKRYARPAAVAIDALAGKWESARGTAIAGGEGINITQTLIINQDGSFQWQASGGGVVAGRSAYDSGKNMTGTVKISGSTMTFTGNDGAAESYTFLPAAGNPVSAFTLGSNTFTRKE